MGLGATASRGGITAPVGRPLPAGLDVGKPLRLVRVSDGREIPVQLSRGSVHWIHEQDIGGEPRKEAYRIEAGVPKEAPRVEVKDVDGKHLLVTYAGKDILRYNYAVIRPPEGVDPVFERSGYIHPIWTPSGKVLTNDSPRNHLHHHGLWGAWTSSQFEGRKSNFWESGFKEGKIECVKVEETFSGPVFGGFRAKHRFLNLNGPGGPKTALDEVWEVRVYALSGQFVFDLVSTQTCATDQPLVIKEYRYGGIGFRGSGDWEGKEGCAFLTSEGKARVDGHATKARWCLMSGKVGGEEGSIAFVDHPSNFRHPQPMRIHPAEPFFNWAVPQGGDFSIEPGKPYVARYRFVVSDGVPQAAQVEAHWKAVAEPAVVLSYGK
ncbi:MAG TPA: PmoA family protein [Planctomycetota bacterium]|nr:PmoA family protein [Planctomycetota bacterium]